LKKAVQILNDVSTIIKKSRVEKRNVWWWLKTGGETLITTAIAFAPEILQLFPEHTLAFKLALPIGFLLKSMKMKKDYQRDELPGGLTKLYDKQSNQKTGIKGSLKFEKEIKELLKSKGVDIK